MFTGAITQYIDVAQLVLYGFWFFFFALVFYLQKESRREGFPLKPNTPVRGQPLEPILPEPKTYLLKEGTTVSLPNDRLDDHRELAAVPLGKFPGAPLVPTGDPMIDGLGPSAWAERAEHPEQDLHGGDRIRPMRALDGKFDVAGFGTDPRGAPVVTFDGDTVGTVSDLWVDHMESFVRYLEVELDGGGTRLLPMPLATVHRQSRASTEGSFFDRLIDRRDHEIRVASVTGEQFRNAPTIATPDRVTLREEDIVQGYFGGGHVWATRQRTESMI